MDIKMEKTMKKLSGSQADRMKSISQRVVHGIVDTNFLDGMSKQRAKNIVNKLLQRHTRGFFTDNLWVPVHNIWKELDKSHIHYDIEKSDYQKDRNGTPISKTWKFKIDFENDRGRQNTLWGVVVASGAGTVTDPLSRYDLVAYVG